MGPGRADWLVIGISGVTCGGKTTLANQLKDRVAPAHLFHQDKYFYPDDSPKHIRCENLDHNNYDVLSSLDMDQMYKDVVCTIKGESRAHWSSTESSGKFTIPGKSFLIVEGFTVLNYKPIAELCDLRYYLTLEYGECWARRCLRLYEPPDVDGYFDRCVWPEHLNYRAQIEKDPRVVLLDGKTPNAVDIVMRDLNARQTS